MSRDKDLGSSTSHFARSTRIWRRRRRRRRRKGTYIQAEKCDLLREAIREIPREIRRKLAETMKDCIAAKSEAVTWHILLLPHFVFTRQISYFGQIQRQKLGDGWFQKKVCLWETDKSGEWSLFLEGDKGETTWFVRYLFIEEQQNRVYVQCIQHIIYLPSLLSFPLFFLSTALHIKFSRHAQ